MSDKIKIDYVKLTPEELQGLDSFLGEIPTKFGLPIINLIANATNRRLAELEAKEKVVQGAEANNEAEQPDFMTPEPTV